jgi:hypothetical protein
MRNLLCAAILACSCGGTVAPQPATPPITAPKPPAEAKAGTTTPSAKSGRAVRYEIVSQKKTSGACDVAIAADGLSTIDCAWVNNGRGPKVHAEIRSAADGTPSLLRVTGTDTFGVPLDETLAIEAGRARWKSQADSGERALSEPAFYVPASPLPTAFGALARAAIGAGDHLALLPSGEARAEREADTTVRGRHVTCWAIIGPDFVPTRVWLDDERELFAVVNPWWSIVPEGLSDVVDGLVEIEKGLEAKRELADYQRLAHAPPTAGLAVVGARVFDAEKKAWRDGWTVVVSAGKIASAGPSSKVKAPAGAEIIDAHGKALLPGLWDMHVHLGAADGPLDIAAGVTTVRDMANDSGVLLDLVERYDGGQAIGPRVLLAGVVEGRGDKALASELYADTEEEGRAALDFYAAHGYVQFKFYNSVKPELVPVLAKAAHERGLRVSGHVPYGMLAEDAVRAGYDEIQHINQVMLELFADRQTDTRTLQRFTLVGERAASLDLRSKPVRDYLALLREHATVIDPTMVAFEQLYLARPGEADPTIRAVADRLPPLVARAFLTGGLEAGGGKDALYRASWRKVLAFLKALHDDGLRIVPGTDGVPGFWLHRELEIYSEAGIPNAEVLYLATLGAARVMGRDKTSGSIEKGKDADLVLVDGDPVARMSDVRKVVTVIKGGVVFDSAAVYATVGVRP